jgi:drug/metabolite transporter (DMT)-like permease
MSAVIFGLAAALSWGVYDFLSRFPSRAVGPILTVLAVTFFGLVVLSAWVLIAGNEITIVWPKLWLVAIAGIFFALATLALFAAFALGPITLVAPIVGAYPALAMIFAVAQGARPSAWQWLAIACVLAGAVITSRSGGRYEDSGELAKGETKIVLGLAVLAGIGFAIGITAGQTAVPIFGDVETVWLARIFGLLTIGLIYLWRTPGATLPLRWLPLLGLMGCLDVVALAALTAAGDLPSPELTTVVSSAFGAITVLLARVFLKEPIAPLQLGGMVLIFGGVAALAAL